MGDVERGMKMGCGCVLVVMAAVGGLLMCVIFLALMG